jgi:hypothetical protein
MRNAQCTTDGGQSRKPARFPPQRHSRRGHCNAISAPTSRERIHIRAIQPFLLIPANCTDAGRGGLSARVPAADQPDSVPPDGGRSLRSARQTCVRFGDDFAVLEVECPCFCKQFANTCEPASGLGGTIGDIRRLHDEAPYRW